MSTQSTGGESRSNLLMGSVIIASALMLYAAFAGPQVQPPAQAAQTVTAVPAIEQVVVTAPSHVS